MRSFKDVYNSLFFTADNKPRANRINMRVQTDKEDVGLSNIVVAGNTPLFTLFPHARRIFKPGSQVLIVISTGAETLQRITCSLPDTATVQEIFEAGHEQYPEPDNMPAETNRIKNQETVITDDGHKYLVMELMEGDTIVENSTTGKRISPKSPRYNMILKKLKETA